MTKILAIDQAKQCGWAWREGNRLISGSVNLGCMSALASGQLDMLYRHIMSIHDKYGIDQIVYEGAAMGHNNRAHEASSEKVGIIKLAAFRINAETRSYAPMSVKYFATGDGHADKNKVIEACMVRFEIVPRDDNEADAIWLSQMAIENYTPGKASKSKKKQPPKTLPGQLSLFGGDKPRRVIRRGAK